MISTTTFNEEDLKQFEELGTTPENVESQINNFINGFPSAELLDACVLNGGITSLDEAELERLKNLWESTSGQLKVIKFVPASGAASRMFKELFGFVENSSEDHPSFSLIQNIEQFAFYNSLRNIIEIPQEKSLDDCVNIAKAILDSAGLGYGSTPKGLIEFHSYADGSRTAFEEHLVEGAHYTKDLNDTVTIHFTVSPEHMDAVKNHLNEKSQKHSDDFEVIYDISYSTQKKSTDTIAVDMNNDPFREESGEILFRPGGHGALIENLNEQDGDVVFIKNIDNVVPDRLKETTYLYKKVIGGVLVEIQAEVSRLIKQLKNNEPGALQEANAFAKEKFFMESDLSQAQLIDFLNRPIRVCGMVKNEGEPGGGPFFVKDSNGFKSAQIIEGSQVNMSDSSQEALFKNSTHFNPVDLVCWIKDHNGAKFDLTRYTDPKTGFISQKSKNGRDLKAQELPGLWNGAMANWLTIFVEVPVITFNPVKVLDDLLRNEHQQR